MKERVLLVCLHVNVCRFLWTIMKSMNINRLKVSLRGTPLMDMALIVGFMPLSYADNCYCEEMFFFIRDSGRCYVASEGLSMPTF